MDAPYPSRLAAELVGTFGFFFLGFTGIAVTVDLPGALGPAGVAAGFGLGLALMIFAFGHISGGHFNPAVTLGLAAGQRFPAREVVGYWAAQLLGGLIAAAVAGAIYLEEAKQAFVSSATVSDGRTFLLEAIGTFLFLLVVSAVATDARAPWYGVLAPLAIGGYIFTAGLVIGPFTSGSFNPARSLAPAIIADNFTDVWIFVLAPLAGGVVGGVAYWLIRASSEEGGSP